MFQGNCSKKIRLNICSAVIPWPDSRCNFSRHIGCYSIFSALFFFDKFSKSFLRQKKQKYVSEAATIKNVYFYFYFRIAVCKNTSDRIKYASSSTIRTPRVLFSVENHLSVLFLGIYAKVV